ncbi:MAG: DUF5110 domain-containing protein, partial [Pontiellaceae bacterium]|nr:DUF5110 domain-containing protein [Pontiellaceae bacterium]
EGDNYNYEKGEFAKITLKWDDSAQTLTIGQRKGEFPGMVKNRTFNVVWVSPGHGVGIEPATADVVVEFTGKAVKVVRTEGK